MTKPTKPKAEAEAAVAPPPKDKDADAAPEEKVFYIVNPAGAVHSVDREHARARLGQVGYRRATKDEIAAYNSRKIQRADKPIAATFTADPDVE